jgi:RNA-directed DNA polymerase
MKTSRPLHAAPAGGGSEQGVQERHRQAKETKRGGTGVRASECRVVPVKRGNPSRGDPAEGRRHRDMESMKGKTAGTPSPGKVSTGLHRIADLARQAPEMAFTTLAHHVDVGLLREAYRLTRKDGAVGVDGKTAKEYGANLEKNLRSLLSRFKSGDYKAPPVRRVYIPKADGKRTRPIGIPTFEDKVLQRAVTMVLEAVYEQDFLDCSYGFRPWHGLMKMGGGWVIEVDVRSFYDTLTHCHLRSFLDRRVRDGVLRRAIDKWLKAGVLEEGRLVHPETGTPQGGVISPLLANVYLHEVMDRWFADVAKPRLQGPVFMVRYADDMLVVCRLEADARKALDVLPKRFGKYGLALHPEKTRLVQFRRPPWMSSRPDRTNGPGSFDFLGFTHYWGRSRKDAWVVKRKTAPSRFGRALRAVAAWMRRHRHQPMAEQHRALCLKIRGHCAYYGITGNARALQNFRHQVGRRWRKWLSRRSGRACLSWEKFQRLLARYPLPFTRVVHSVYLSAANP